MKRKKIGAIIIALGLIFSMGTEYIANANDTSEITKSYTEGKEEVIKTSGEDIELNLGDEWNVELHKVEAQDVNDASKKYVITPVSNSEDPEDISKAIDREGKTIKTGQYRVTFLVSDKELSDEEISTGAGVKAEFVKTITIKSEDSKENIPQVTGTGVVVTEGGTLDTQRFGIKVFDIEDSEDEVKQKALMDSVTINTEKVDTKKVGEYPVVVKAIDSDGHVGEETFTVTVVENSKPIIEGEVDFKILLNGEFKIDMLNLKAYDDEDGDLTDKIVLQGVDKVNTKKVGKYQVVATVADRLGKTTTKEFTVEVITDNKPIIDGKNLELFVGDKFELSMLQITAKDAEDGDLTKEIGYKGMVNTGRVGTYKVLAMVMDSDWNIASKEFFVKVSAKKPTTTTVKPEANNNNANSNNPNTGDESPIKELVAGIMALGTLLFIRKR